MLEYGSIDLSEGIDINKCKYIYKKCSLCKFYYFLDKNFNYGPYLCDGCYDMSLKAKSMNNLSLIAMSKLIVLILHPCLKMMLLI